MSSVALVMMAVRSPLRWLRGMLEDLYLKEKETALCELRAAPAGASASILFDQSLGSPTPNGNLLLSIPARCFCHNSYSHYFRWTFVKSPEWHTVHLMGRALCPELVLC